MKDYHITWRRHTHTLITESNSVSFFFFFYGLQHILIFLHCYRLEMQNMLRYVLKSNVAKVRQFQNKASLYQLNSICCHFGIADKKKKIMWRQGPLKCRVRCGCNSYSPLRMALCEGDSCKTKTQNKKKNRKIMCSYYFKVLVIPEITK